MAGGGAIGDHSPGAGALPEAGRAGDTAAPVELAITMWIPSDLVERAEKWGAAMRLPAGKPIWLAKRPSLSAVAARFWDSSAKASWSSRLMAFSAPGLPPMKYSSPWTALVRILSGAAARSARPVA